MDWDTLTKEALQELGADQVMVPGAKLREHMVRAGYAAGFDVVGHVAKSGTSFSRLVDGVPGITVRVRPGSDVAIGLEGARIPDYSSGQREASQSRHEGLRSDVYQAFTRVSKIPFVYLPGADRFVPEDRAEGPSIAVNSQTLERLISFRQEFIDTLPLEDRQPLRDSLVSTNPLSDFRREVSARGILVEWVLAQEKKIKEQVLQWASEHGVTPRDSWFRRSHLSMTNAHRTLARLTPYFTPDEIRDLRIPFRAVEALLTELQE